MPYVPESLLAVLAGKPDVSVGGCALPPVLPRVSEQNSSLPEEKTSVTL